MPIERSAGGGGGTSGLGTDGWNSLSGTFTFSSADAPTFVASTPSDLTGTIPVGARLKVTQTTVKYFIVTAVSATTITLYGGTSFVLANAAISSPAWSPVKVPFAFPIDPAGWTETVTNTSACEKANPTQNVWYGDTGLTPTGPSLSIPIGCWRVLYESPIQGIKAAAAADVYATLSTASNTESDTSMTSVVLIATNATSANIINYAHRERTLTLAAKATYYLNIKTDATLQTDIFLRGDVAPTIVRAICAYL